MSLRHVRLVLVAGLTVTIAACASSTGTAAPSAVDAQPTATALAPTSAPTPQPTASPTPTDTPRASEPSGGLAGGRTGRIEFPDSGFAVTLPDGWVEVGLTEDDIATLLGGLDDETAAEALRQQLPALLAAGVKLWAFDTALESAGSNLSVVVQPGSFPTNLLRPFVNQALSQAPGIVSPEVSTVSIDGQDALRVDYVLDQPTAGGPNIHAAGAQVYASAGGSLYIFTVTLPEGGTNTIEAIVDSIEFLD